MNTAGDNFRAAYGAHQLKAAYQRNMLTALGTTTALVALGVVIGSYLLGPSQVPAAPPPPDPGPDSIIVNLRGWDPPAPLAPDPKPKPPKPVNNDGGRLTPVQDDTVDPQDDPVRPVEPGYVGPGVGLDTGEYEDGWIGGSGTGEEPLPPRGIFVAAERQPELVYSVEPEYPRFLREVGIEGVVVMTALVGRKGDVLDAAVYVSSGNKLLDEAALAVAGKYKYTPAVQNGRPVAIWVTYKVVFSLAKK